MIVQSYENTRRADSCIEYIEKLKNMPDVEKIILLPIPTTKDKQTILNTNIYINSLLDDIDDKTFVCGYGLPTEFVRGVESRGSPFFDLGKDEEFLLENAEITAVCTLGIILNSTIFSPRDLRVGIVGYGRIGKKLSRMLLQLGARVRVYTSRTGVRDELCTYGVDCTTDKDEISKLNILVNTAPAKIFSREDIPSSVRIIELASGDNFPDFKDVERYPSIPAKMFPASAGRAWGRAIERYFLNNL